MFDVSLLEVRTLDNDACRFGYRDSLFKHEGKGRYIVTEVTFRVRATPHPKITYKDLKARFEHKPSPTLRAIRAVVLETRKGKFPDWHVLGTAGSFFKNPFISEEHYKKLQAQFVLIPGYRQPDGRYKIALGWFLEHVLSLKGYREGRVGLYEHQALVLVNHESASAEEVRAFSESIIKKIFNATHIIVEREVVYLE